MVRYSERDGSVTFQVRVVPRAARSEIVGDHDGALRVRIAAPPVENAANEELLRLLAAAFRVRRSRVEITAGHTSKLKTVVITNADLAVVERLRQA